MSAVWWFAAGLVLGAVPVTLAAKRAIRRAYWEGFNHAASGAAVGYDIRRARRRPDWWDRLAVRRVDQEEHTEETEGWNP
jgi:hypothetical protein